MVNLKWCQSQSKGIKLIEPNNNLANEYLNSAEETLSILKEIDGKSNMWLATTKYYFEYFCFYAFLMKIGVKCEIHDCTLELCKLFEKNNFLPIKTYDILENDKDLRIDNQYRLKNIPIKINYDELTMFFLKYKDNINNLTTENIKKIRDSI